MRERLRTIRQKYGILGIYRGFLPGAGSIFLRNGASMILMQAAQKYLTDNGYRD
jgi:hypothetical protein